VTFTPTNTREAGQRMREALGEQPPRFADLVEATRGLSVAEAAAAWDRASDWATQAAVLAPPDQRFLAWSELARQVSAAHLAVRVLHERAMRRGGR
jgi:hypothetical protein